MARKDANELGDLLLKKKYLSALFLDEKDLKILSTIAKMLPYWPDDDFKSSILFSLFRLPKEFKKIRCVAHVRRMICAEFFYKKKILQACYQKFHKRNLFVKLLKTQLEFPFGIRDVLGIMVAFNLMKQREIFEEGHILEAIRRVIPNAIVIKGTHSKSHGK